MPLNQLSAVKLKNLLERREASSRDIMQSVLARIDEVERDIGAFLTVRPPGELLAEAEAIDGRRARGEMVGPLAGLPIAIKDNIHTRGLRTTCASRILENFVPPYDATVIRKIREADGIVLGKTNLDEFAMGSSTENSAFQVTRNPHNREYVPGGSSGGSAAAVAAHEAVLALGSDTGGSVRLPASYCGVVGFKPTYGRVSRYGLVAFGSSLDQIGPLANTVADAELLYNVISGHDPKDSTSVPEERAAANGHDRGGLRIGLPKEYFIEGLDRELRAACDRTIGILKSQGHTVSEVSLPHAEYAIPTYYIIATAEASSNLARYAGFHFGYRAPEYQNLADMIGRTRTQGFGAEVRRRIMLGTYVLSAGYYDAYYTKALKVRALIRRDFREVFQSHDLILSPVSPGPAFKLGEKTADPLTMYLVDIYTVTANLAGLPAISVPAGLSSTGLPLSIQLTAPWLADSMLLKAARGVEQDLRHA